MTSADDKLREQRALEAMIVAALRQEDDDEVAFNDPAVYEQALSPEDLDALSQLPDDLVARIVSGTVEPQPADPLQSHEEQLLADMQFASGLNRGNEDDQLSDKARDEIERRIEEADHADGEASDKDEPDGQNETETPE